VSAENLDLVRRIYLEWELGDFSSNDWADPEIEYEIPELSAEVHHGIEEMKRAWLNWAGEWEDLSIRPTGIRELADGRILTTHSFHGKGRTSGVPVDELPGAGIWTFRDGKVVRYQGYTEVERAFADAGVERGPS
jgi:ketosteroid isomerase-like protein